MHSPQWNVIFWSSWAVLGLAVELLGVVDHRFLTITYVVRMFIPKPVIAGILVALAYHFLWQK